MLGFTSVVAMGTLLKDVDIKYLQSGKAVANLYVAVNKRYVKDGEKFDKATFLNCTAFGATAETISKFFSKGSGIILRGELEDSQWKSNEGKDMRSTKLIVSSFNFVGGTKAEGSSGTANKGSESKGSGNSRDIQQHDDVPEEALPF